MRISEVKEATLEAFEEALSTLEDEIKLIKNDIYTYDSVDEALSFFKSYVYDPLKLSLEGAKNEE